MNDARQQLLATIEGAVGEALDRRLDELADSLAERVVRRMTVESAGDTPELIDAAEVARRFNVGRDYVYEHAERLGVIRLGAGPKARLRFDPATVAKALGASVPEPKVRGGGGRARRRPAVELLPVAGERS